MNKTALACLYLTLQACSHDTFFMKIESSLSGYGSAIRWGLYQKASEYLAQRQALNLASYKNLHVTSYDPIYRHEFDDHETIEQTVEIRYYLETDRVEKSITDHQTWRYDQDKSAWLLQSGLPKFKW